MKNNDNEFEYKIGGQIWVQKDGANFMGPGRAVLLEHLANGHTIYEAAELMEMEREVAVKNIEAINKIAKEPLTKTAAKECCEVTEYGKKIISMYKELRKKHNNILKELNCQFCEMVSK